MGFFETLRHVLHDDFAGATKPRTDEPKAVTKGENSAAGSGQSSDDVACWYDRTEWRKKLQRILDGLPKTQPEWDTLVSEARTLKLDPTWVSRCEREEFNFMIRRAVSDRVVAEPEHHKLDLARELIGMPEPEAEAQLHAIVAEAESIFGKPVQDGDEATFFGSST
jgi:hypothetical protein